MQVIESIAAMQSQALVWRSQGLRLGFVPTMGFLHEGHASLMRLARPQCDKLIVSIYVNPTQFAPSEDYAAYPRDLTRDRACCEREGVDIVFLPSNLYALDHSVVVRETELTKGLCGMSRPAHFEGVATVVVKLLNIVQPHVAVFGQKDAQQAQVIRRVVRDLNMPVDLVLGPIHREPDGLAMSSRNTYLSPADRVSALSLSRSLNIADRMFVAGERSAEVIRSTILTQLEATPRLKVDYVEIVHPETLSPLATIKDSALVALAAIVGHTRLIDNCVLRLP